MAIQGYRNDLNAPPEDAPILVSSDYDGTLYQGDIGEQIFEEYIRDTFGVPDDVTFHQWLPDNYSGGDEFIAEISNYPERYIEMMEKIAQNQVMEEHRDGLIRAMETVSDRAETLVNTAGWKKAVRANTPEQLFDGFIGAETTEGDQTPRFNGRDWKPGNLDRYIERELGYDPGEVFVLHLGDGSSDLEMYKRADIGIHISSDESEAVEQADINVIEEDPAKSFTGDLLEKIVTGRNNLNEILEQNSMEQREMPENSVVVASGNELRAEAD